MKNKKFIIGLTALVIIGGVFATLQFTSNSASAYLSKEEARKKVSDQFSGEIVELELDEEDNQKVYEIEMEGTDRDYELKINAETGKIIKLEEKVKKQKTPEVENEDKVTANTEDDQETNNKDVDKNDDQNDSEQKATQTDDADSENDYVKNAQKKQSAKTLISNEKAKSIALSQYNGTIIEVELDDDDGKKYYEIEMTTTSEEVKMEIDAYTGEIISISKDELDDDDGDDD